MKIAVIIGNPNPAGRTTTVAEAVAARIGAAVGRETEITAFELAEISGDLFRWGAEPVERVVEAVRTSAVAVFASPTYKASYTGLLKAFLDRFPNNGLDGVVAVPVMLGGAPIHHLAVETQLRPVLVELAAVVPSKGLFVIDSQMDSLSETIEAWWELAQRPILRYLG